MNKRKELVSKILRSLEESPDEWFQDRYTIDNSEMGIRIWTANVPVLNLHIWKPFPVSFTLWQKIKLYRAIKKVNATNVIKILEQ